MKKFITLLLNLTLLFSLAACGAADGKAEPEPPQPDEWGITFTVQDATPSGLTLIITQTGGITGGNLETGADYYLEQTFDGINWSQVPPTSEPVWDMMVRIIPTDDALEWELNWEWLYHVLEPGQYRICKTITLFGESGSAESRLYCAEFEVK